MELSMAAPNLRAYALARLNLSLCLSCGRGLTPLLYTIAIIQSSTNFHSEPKNIHNTVVCL